MRLMELVPVEFKHYLKLIVCKLRYRDCFIDSPTLGPNVRLGYGCSISRDVEIGENVSVGRYSYINRGSIVASGTVGSFCSIGPYALIGMPEHPTGLLSTSPLLYRSGNILARASDGNEYPSPPKVGNDVWIGASAFIRQGSMLGDGAVVGAGAVVTHDVPPYGVVAGVPAKLLRFRFEPKVISFLLELRWWERNVRDLAALGSQFDAIATAAHFEPAPAPGQGIHP